jgi:hypothetical protein
MEGGLMQARAAGHLGPFDDCVAVLREHFDVLRRQAAAAKRAGARTGRKPRAAAKKNRRKSR